MDAARSLGEPSTIVAQASPPGRGAVSLLRLSGRDALGILAHLSRKQPSSFRDRRATVCPLYSQGEELDRVVVTVYRGPRSYTGEDVVEISCHGSPWILGQVLQTCIEAGAQAARPGEFTLRAFLNGRMDLVQAEAVNDLIRSETAFQAAVARRQLEGALSRTLRPVREELAEALTQLETAIEFVEEDVSPEHRESITRRLGETGAGLARLAGTWGSGRVLREGARVVLAGRPNVGKSSIFNCLVREERALVTAHPGTTRDALREYLDVEGVPVWLVDTAGLRRGRLAEVERLGVDRSREAIGRAELVLLVLDRSEVWSPQDDRVWRELGEQRYLVVLNKADLPPRLKLPARIAAGAAGTVTVSARDGAGIEGLARLIAQSVLPAELRDGETELVTNARHRACLEEAGTRVAAASARLEEGWSEEVAVYEIRRALDALEELTGALSSEELLGRIFSTFCIGK